jgi:hypothetical protein
MKLRIHHYIQEMLNVKEVVADDQQGKINITT